MIFDADDSCTIVSMCTHVTCQSAVSYRAGVIMSVCRQDRQLPPNTRPMLHFFYIKNHLLHGYAVKTSVLQQIHAQVYHLLKKRKRRKQPRIQLANKSGAMTVIYRLRFGINPADLTNLLAFKRCSSSPLNGEF